MRNWKKWVCLTAAGMAFFMAGCGKEAAVSTEAPLVKTVVAGEAAKGEKTSFSGTVHGYFESPLAFQTGGRIMARYVDQGQRVSAGEALMKVDSKDAEEQVASAQSAVIASRAKADLAYSTLARYEKLHAANAISDLNMDQVRNQAQLAQAELDSSEAALSRAENNLGFTLLTADRDGVIGSTLYEVGQVVAAGTPVVTIIDDSRLDVHISLTEKQYRSYGVGTPATVTFWALPGVTVEGTVRDVAGSRSQFPDRHLRCQGDPGGSAGHRGCRHDGRSEIRQSEGQSGIHDTAVGHGFPERESVRVDRKGRQSPSGAGNGGPVWG